MGVVMVSGAPGAGKTTVAPGLRAALPGVVVLDLDDFLGAAGRLAGVDLRQGSAADRWPAYDELCLSFVAAVRAAGHDVVVLSPLTPEQVRRSGVPLGAVRWAVLDCPDATRAERLRRRSPAADVAGALADAAELRALGVPVLGTDGLGVDAVVRVVAGWVAGGGG